MHNSIAEPAPQQSVYAPAPVPAAAPAEVARQLDPIDDAPPSFATPPSIVAPLVQNQAVKVNQQLWERFLVIFEQRYPLKAGIIKHARFANCRMGELSLAVHPDDSMTRDALTDPNTQDDILNIFEELSHQRLRLRAISDSAMPAPQEIDSSARLPLPEPLASTPKVAPPMPQAVDPSIEEAQKQREEEFYNDPLIQTALREFNARIIP